MIQGRKTTTTTTNKTKTKQLWYLFSNSSYLSFLWKYNPWAEIAISLNVYLPFLPWKYNCLLYIDFPDSKLCFKVLQPGRNTWLEFCQWYWTEMQVMCPGAPPSDTAAGPLPASSNCPVSYYLGFGQHLGPWRGGPHRADRVSLEDIFILETEMPS